MQQAVATLTVVVMVSATVVRGVGTEACRERRSELSQKYKPSSWLASYAP